MPGTTRRVPLFGGRGAQLQHRDLGVSRQGRGSRGRALLATPRPAVGGAHSLMSSAPPRSPTPRAPKMKKDESFLGKLGGTLARKKKTREGECGPRVPLAPAGCQRCPPCVRSLPASAAPMSPPVAFRLSDLWDRPVPVPTTFAVLARCPGLASCSGHRPSKLRFLCPSLSCDTLVTVIGHMLVERKGC